MWYFGNIPFEDNNKKSYKQHQYNQKNHDNQFENDTVFLKVMNASLYLMV